MRNPLVHVSALLVLLSGLALNARAQGIEPSALSGIVIDDIKAELVGDWTTSTSVKPFLGQGYIHDAGNAKGEKSAKFHFRVDKPGEYHLLIGYTSSGNRASKVPVTITSGDQKGTFFIDQKKRPELATGFTSIGTFFFAADEDSSVLIETTGTKDVVIVDGIRILTADQLTAAQKDEKRLPKNIARTKPTEKKEELPPPVAPKFKRQPGKTQHAKVTSDDFDKLLGVGPENELDLVDDIHFFRRVSLDLVGRQPTLDEYRTFLANKSEDRRAEAVETFLASPDFGKNWGNYWSDVIAMRTPEPQLTFLDYKPFRAWLADNLNSGTGWDETAFCMLTAIGKVGNDPAATFVGFHQGEGNRIAGELSRVFLGVRIACAECHDHPFVDMPQETFHGMAAFFARVKVKLEHNDSRKINISSDAKAEHKMPGGKGMMKPTVYKGDALELGLADLERREKLAYWLVDGDNPFFARSFVNHLQARLMGRGFFDPVDDLGEGAEPLLAEAHEALASHFIASNFDAKSVFRVLVNTKAYQAVERVEMTPPSDSTDAESADRIAVFTGARPKKLRGDEVFDSLVAAISLPDVKGEQEKPTAAVRFPPPPKSTRDLVNDAFAYDPVYRDSLINRTMKQAMFLINNDQVLKQVDAAPQSETMLSKLLREEDDNELVVKVLYARVLAREPSDREREIVLQHVESVENRDRAFEDVLWSLLNSAEFTTRN